jgi:group I intron endonuclease
MGCVYLATNRINGKCYVGQTINFDKRKKAHKDTAYNGKGWLFHNAIRKYGFDAFNWELLYCREMLCPEKDKASMDRCEKYYIKTLNTMAPNGYNLTAGGEGMDSESAKRINSMPDVKAKISASCRKAQSSLEYKTRHSEIMKLVLANPEVKARQGAAIRKALSDPKVRADREKARKNATSSPEYKERHREATKRALANPEVKSRQGAAIRKALAIPKIKAKQKVAIKKAVNAPGFQARRIVSYKKTCTQRRNNKPIIAQKT